MGGVAERLKREAGDVATLQQFDRLYFAVIGGDNGELMVDRFNRRWTSRQITKADGLTLATSSDGSTEQDVNW